MMDSYLLLLLLSKAD